MTDSQIKKAAYKLIKSQDSVALRELVGDLLKRLQELKKENDDLKFKTQYRRSVWWQ